MVRRKPLLTVPIQPPGNFTRSRQENRRVRITLPSHIAFRHVGLLTDEHIGVNHFDAEVDMLVCERLPERAVFFWIELVLLEIWDLGSECACE